ncbi:dihydropteroate synthase [Barnesiella sp. An55]|uniref:dihydropteroate synthase n=1 Tax=Barnesiella sp. An55 TaxID=1965646 RepID=UPI000B39C0FB|nr:dihydropteroate synthase [Barnesiella sp. An55]OUN73402.1 dihydropteroate synthase [Barnesiella sp. An55]
MILRNVPNKPLSLNLGGELVSLSRPRVMGILNVTPDSFYAGSRTPEREQIAARVRQIIDEGADIIDIGAYSSRPQATDISPDEEMRRLATGLEIIRTLYPRAHVSVDTFRAEIASRCVREYGVQIVNDISGGELDSHMFETVADLKVAYILMHMKGTPQTMMQQTRYDHLMAEMLYYFAERIARLENLGVNDIIIDPGFGFSKTLDDNYRLMNRLDEFARIGLPLLVGISRKSMIYKMLGTSPDESLNGTSVLNTLALLGGAHILRVHDVKEAVETIKIVSKTLQSTE